MRTINRASQGCVVHLKLLMTCGVFYTSASSCRSLATDLIIILWNSNDPRTNRVCLSVFLADVVSFAICVICQGVWSLSGGVKPTTGAKLTLLVKLHVGLSLRKTLRNGGRTNGGYGLWYNGRWFIWKFRKSHQLHLFGDPMCVVFIRPYSWHHRECVHHFNSVVP